MSDRLTAVARLLRKRPTEAEKLLWNKLRALQLEGYKFRRQQPIGQYIVDFVNFKKKLLLSLMVASTHIIQRKTEKEMISWTGKVLRF